MNSWMIDKLFMEYDLNVFMILLEKDFNDQRTRMASLERCDVLLWAFLGFITLVDQTDVQNSNNDLAS